MPMPGGRPRTMEILRVFWLRLRSPFRSGSDGYVNFLRRRTLPNPVLSRRSSFESLRTNGESKGTIQGRDRLDETTSFYIMNERGISLGQHRVRIGIDVGGTF